MADRVRRFALGGFALPVLFLAMSGLASAAPLTVTNTHDTGAGSLRAAILAASSGDVINFNVSGTITLGSILPEISINLTIDGSGQAITVDGAGAHQILLVNSAGTLDLKFLTLAHGSVTGFDAFGGAIFNDGMLTVTNCTFLSNQATGTNGFGGAISNSGTLTVTNSTFSGNHASGVIAGGGAILNTGTLTLINSVFSTNQATGGTDGGGAIFSDDTLTVTNCTFSANQATTRGGAISSIGTLTVTNSTFSGNIAASSDGGGIANGATTTLKGTILADSGVSGNCSGTVTDAGYNISDDGSCGFKMPPSGTSVNNSMTLHLDPLGLQNNGGPTNTIALEPDSEAVDFIPIANCTDQSPTPQQLTTDQRGLPRPDPGNPNFCDAGAFELQTMPFVLAPNSERVQIARSTTADSDQVNMAFTFTENGFPSCDSGDNAFNGVDVDLLAGSCETHDHTGLFLSLDSWSVHTVNKENYGTLFQSLSPGTVSARMVQLPTPSAPACGEWTVNIEVAGIDSSDIGNGPFSLVLSNPDGDTGCFDITNAIVGGQTPPPPLGGHRRRVRR